MINQNYINSLMELGEVDSENADYFRKMLEEFVSHEARILLIKEKESPDERDLLLKMQEQLRELKEEVDEKWGYEEAIEEFGKDPFYDHYAVACKIGRNYAYDALKHCVSLQDFKDVLNDMFTAHLNYMPALGLNPPANALRFGHDHPAEELPVSKSSVSDKYDDL